jgi:hypothetical protein
LNKQITVSKGAQLMDVLDAAIKHKSLWKSYGLAAATQESLWKSYVGDVVVIVVEQAWYMYG